MSLNRSGHLTGCCVVVMAAAFDSVAVAQAVVFQTDFDAGVASEIAFAMGSARRRLPSSHDDAASTRLIHVPIATDSTSDSVQRERQFCGIYARG